MYRADIELARPLHTNIALLMSTSGPQLRLNYFMRSAARSEEFGYIYAPVPKAANTYLKHLLWTQHNRCGHETPPPAKYHGIHNANWIFSEPESGCPWETYGKNDVDRLVDEFTRSESLLRFSCVRNPYSRVLSAYLDKISRNKSSDEELVRRFRIPRRPQSFDEFISMIVDQDDADRNVHWMSQVYTLRYNYFMYDKLFFFESLQDITDFIQHQLIARNTPSAEPAINGSSHKTHADQKIETYYNTQLIEKVCRLFNDDFQYFGYSADPATLHSNRKIIPSGRLSEQARMQK